MLDRLRGRIGSALLGLGRSAARVMPSPTAWTLTGLFFSLLAAILFALGHPLTDVLAGLMVLASGVFDIVDGAVARATARISKRGAFLDSMLDRVGETSLYLGILVGGHTAPVLVFAALALSLLVSYARAKADGLGVSLAGVGLGERSERLVVIIVAALLGVIPLGVLIVAVIAGITFVERVVRAAAAIR